jgi:type I restriction enzyme S subunit
MSFPRYPKYKPSGVEWLGEVPEGWDVAALKRGFTVTLGKMLQPEQTCPTDVLLPYLRAANIQWGGVDSSDIKQMWLSPRDRAQLFLCKGDLLVSEGGDVGRSCVWQEELDECYFQNSVNRVRARKGNSNRYLCYWMAVMKDKGYVDVLCNKSTIAHFTAEKVAAVPVPFPPLAEQTAIAEFLDRETGKIDGLVAEQRRLMELLKEKRQAVISHAVTKGLNPHAPMKPSGIEWLGDVPVGWEVQRIKFVTKGMKAGPFGSALTKDVYVSEGYRVYGQEQVIPNDFSIGDYFITPEKYDELSQYRVSPGDILISCVGTFGKIAIVPVGIAPGIINPRLIRLRCGNSVKSEYLVEVMRSTVTFEQLSSTSRGGTMDIINIGTLSGIFLALPPMPEQLELLTFIHQESAKFDTLTAEAQRAIDLLQERRAALISAAVTGEIDVRQQVRN